MSAFHSARQEADTVWKSIYDSTIDPEPALDALSDRYLDMRSVQEYFAGQFYHLARHAYIALGNGNASEAAAGFSQTATRLLYDVKRALDERTNHPGINNFFGIANEFTPIAIMPDIPLSLATRDQDQREKTDLILHDEDRSIAVQAKTDEYYTIGAAPENGVLITAKDFGNQHLRVTQAVVRYDRDPTRYHAKILNFAEQSLIECIRRRAEDRELQAKELAEKAAQVNPKKKFKRPNVALPIAHFPFLTDEMRAFIDSLPVEHEAETQDIA